MGFSFLFRIPDSIKMTRGPKKHMKRLAAPKSWMLDKLGGVYSVRPNSGPHRLRESMPLAIFLRNRLKYALTDKEAKYKLCRVREVKTGPKNVPYLYTSDGRTI